MSENFFEEQFSIPKEKIGISGPLFHSITREGGDGIFSKTQFNLLVLCDLEGKSKVKLVIRDETDGEKTLCFDQIKNRVFGNFSFARFLTKGKETKEDIHEIAESIFRTIVLYISSIKSKGETILFFKLEFLIGNWLFQDMLSQDLKNLGSFFPLISSEDITNDLKSRWSDEDTREMLKFLKGDFRIFADHVFDLKGE